MSLSVLGYAFLILSVLSFAFYSVFVEKFGGSYTSLEITFAMLTTGAVFYAIIATVLQKT